MDPGDLKRLADEAGIQDPFTPGEGVVATDPANLGKAFSQKAISDAIAGGYKLTGLCVQAETLRQCCRDVDGHFDPHGLYLENVVILGELDFDGLEVSFPIRFERCTFQHHAKFQGARMSSLMLTGCCVPGLMANGISLDRELDLSGSHFQLAHSTDASMTRKATIWLCDARIGGRLHCVDTWIDATQVAGHQPGNVHGNQANCSMIADRVKVGGPVRLIHQFISIGQIRLIGAHINGSLDLTGAQLLPSRGLALDLEDAQIDGSVFIVEHPKHQADNPDHEDCQRASHDECKTKVDVPERVPKITGRVDLGSTRIASRFIIRKARISQRHPEEEGSYGKSAPPGTVIHAPRISVGARVQITGRSTIRGGIDMAMSALSGLYVEKHSAILARGLDALNLSHAEVRGRVVVAQSTDVEGTIRLDGAVVHGDLALHGELKLPKKASLVSGSPMTVDGRVLLSGLRATGGRVQFRGASLGSLDADGAKLANPGLESLNLKQARIHGSVRLVDFTSVGLTVLNRCRVEGRLLFTGGSFSAPDPTLAPGATITNPRQKDALSPVRSRHAIEVMSADVRGGMDLGWKCAEPSVDFTDTKTTSLADDPKRWPDKIAIAGFHYDRLDSPRDRTTRQIWDAEARCVWLGRQEIFDSGPYEHAAAVFRQQGYVSEAEQILIERHRRARRAARELSAERRAQRRTAREESRRPAKQGENSTPEPESANASPGPRQWATEVARESSSAMRRIGSRLYGLVGYGYKPGRVLPAILVLVGIVFVLLQIPRFQATLRATSLTGTVYTTSGAAPSGGKNASLLIGKSRDTCDDGQVRCFSSGLYAIDTVIPLISLDQRSTWYPDQHVPYGEWTQFILDTAAILGWLLSSIFVLSLARLARST